MTQTGSGDPALAHYYPAWLDRLADDATLEGSMMDGVLQGAEGVRAVIVGIRGIYEYQEFHFVGPYGEHGWMEDYTARVSGQPIKNVTLVTSDAAGQTRRVVGNYRPRSTLLVLSRLLGEKFAGTPLAQYFLTSES
jgi:transcriptional regulator of met regulon